MTGSSSSSDAGPGPAPPPPPPHVVECPHCGGCVEIARGEINCGVFRHGVRRSSGAQLPPHAGRDECESAVASGDVLGCGRPFRVALGARDGTPAVAVACGFDA